jgi:hypothetical protein
MSRRRARTYWCMDCNQYAVPGPYRKCEDCAGDEYVDPWIEHPHLFGGMATRELCTLCKVNEARATGPECLDCYFSPGGVFDQRRNPVKPTRPVYPIPAVADEVTYHPRVSVTA